MPDSTNATFTHVDHLWDDADAAKLDSVGRLVYRSNLLGSDQRVTNTGGGNTSSKLGEVDPLTGEPVKVLWVKGSGGDLRTSRRDNFSSLYLGKLSDLKRTYHAAEVTGAKTPVEDAMVGLYPHATFDLNPRASSIDTPLHAFIPAAHVDHMHPNAVIAVAACKDQERLTEEIWGGRMAFVPWQRPGFDLGLKMEAAIEQNPGVVGLLMGQHGLINWADDDKQCYDLTLDLIETAARYIAERDKGDQTFGGARCESLADEKRDALLADLLPWLRGRVSQRNRMVGTVEHRDAVMTFVNSADARRLAEVGTSCPDHFLRTKIKPLYVEWDPASGDVESLKKALDEGIETYRADYAAYYEQCRHPDSPAMRDPNPTVVLIPGVGMVAWGKSKSESRVTAEFYACAVEVMRGAEAISSYHGLDRQEAFDIEYWLLEEAKLQADAQGEGAGPAGVRSSSAAGSGIGRETCHRLAGEGAVVVAVDLNADAAAATAAEIVRHDRSGKRHRRRGQRHFSGCGDAVGVLGRHHGPGQLPRRRRPRRRSPTAGSTT